MKKVNGSRISSSKTFPWCVLGHLTLPTQSVILCETLSGTGHLLHSVYQPVLGLPHLHLPHATPSPSPYWATCSHPSSESARTIHIGLTGNKLFLKAGQEGRPWWRLRVQS